MLRRFLSVWIFGWLSVLIVVCLIHLFAVGGSAAINSEAAVRLWIILDDIPPADKLIIGGIYFVGAALAIGARLQRIGVFLLGCLTGPLSIFAFYSYSQEWPSQMDTLFVMVMIAALLSGALFAFNGRSARGE